MSDTKFSQFIAAKKIDARRLAAVSHGLESLTVEDRKIRLAKRLARKAEGGAKEKDTRKPRSGRPVTPRALAAALSGKEKLSGPTKTRILKAVNAILAGKKADAAQLKDLF
jgi:hypothetical protein